VASGRATVQTSNFTVFTVSSYTAVGTGELLGISGTQEVVLYQIGAASFSADATKCAEANVAPVPRLLPTATNCPTFTGNGVYQFGRMPVTIYIDPNAKNAPGDGGPLILYYHATLSGPVEVLAGFGLANIETVVSRGGVVAAFQSTACSFCTTTDDWYWYVEDDDIQDQVVACAIQQAKIDTRHTCGVSCLLPEHARGLMGLTSAGRLDP